MLLFPLVMLRNSRVKLSDGFVLMLSEFLLLMLDFRERGGKRLKRLGTEIASHMISLMSYGQINGCPAPFSFKTSLLAQGLQS